MAHQISPCNPLATFTHKQKIKEHIMVTVQLFVSSYIQLYATAKLFSSPDLKKYLFFSYVKYS
jgi:hypothetical protein